MCAGLIPSVKAAQINSNRGAVSFVKCVQQGSIHAIHTKSSKKESAGIRYSVKYRFGCASRARALFVCLILFQMACPHS
jgi:hypothetical protein